MAIPHGRAKGLKEATGAYIRLKAPIPYDSPDGKPVQSLFVLLVPDQANDLHLQVLSELAHRFSNRQLRETLLTVADAATAYRLLAEWPAHA